MLASLHFTWFSVSVCVYKEEIELLKDIPGNIILCYYLISLGFSCFCNSYVPSRKNEPGGKSARDYKARIMFSLLGSFGIGPLV